MLKLQTNGKFGIYLNHCELINEAYSKTLEDGPAYKLKSELFNFKPKVEKTPLSTAITTATTVPIKTKAGKRKRKAQRTVEETPLELIDCLAQLQTNGHLPGKCSDDAAEALPRCWEETNHVATLPVFHGANPTGQFQKHSFDNNTYLIPPQCRFYNCDVKEMSARLLPAAEALFDLIVLDPPWRNKYIRRLKRAREELAYPTMDVQQLLDHLPIQRFIHSNSLVAIWCTNSPQHQEAVLRELLPDWRLQLLHTLKWYKLNTQGELIGQLHASLGHKQPYEVLFLARHEESSTEFACALQNIEFLLGVPSIVHSHKPPLLRWLREFLPQDPNCLEIFARYLQPHFTSIGLEVLKLMDERLYTPEGGSNNECPQQGN